MFKLFFLAIICVICGCTKTTSEKPDSFDFMPGEKLAELDNDKIEEASGIAASINNMGLLWIHNDSGNPAEIFLVDQHLKIKMICNLKDVENRDWEDITIGPGPDRTKNYLYVGEIGDNLAQYEYKIVYRFEEPVLNEDSVVRITIDTFDRIVFKLDDKKKDAEALLLNPITKDLYIISKREEPVVVYGLKFPQSTTDTTTAESITTLPLTQIVGGGFSSDGKQILLKNYHNVFLWTVREGEPIQEVFKRKGKVLPYAKEPQGEAIGFAQDGSGYFTISEKVRGEKSFLQFYKKK